MPDEQKPAPLTMEKLREMAARARTPEQEAYYAEVSERSRRIQEHGIPAPVSGTFGGKPKAGK